MAKSLNRVTLLGNLGQDPEFRTTPQGSSVCTLNIATSESYKDKNSGEWKDSTEWHRVTLWDYLADNANKYLKKGNKVYIEGKLKTRSYEDRDGSKKYITEVLAQSMILLGGPTSEGGTYQRNSESSGSTISNAPSGGFNNTSYSEENVGFDDDLPF